MPERIAVIMATPPGFNPGMLLSELTAKAICERNGLSSSVTYFRFVPMADRLAPREAERRRRVYERCDIGLEFEHLRRAASLRDFSPLYWGDFLHMRQYVQGISELLARDGGSDSAEELLLLAGAAPALVARAVSCGSTLIFNSANDLRDPAYGPHLKSLVRAMRAILVRDTVSAAQLAALTGEQRQFLGVDTTQFITLFRDWHDVFGAGAEFYPAEEGIGVAFFARAKHATGGLSRILERLRSVLGVRFRWAPWGDESAFPHLSGLAAHLHLDPIRGPESPGLADLIEAVARARIVVTDTYHLAVIAWSLGVPALMLKGDNWTDERDVNAGHWGSRPDKRYAFYEQHELLDLFLDEAIVGDREQLERALDQAVALIAEGAIVQRHLAAVRRRAAWTEARLLEALVAGTKSTGAQGRPPPSPPPPVSSGQAAEGKPSSAPLRALLGGEPQVLPETDKGRATRQLIHRELLRGVGWIRGREARRAVERAGLRELHRHFPRADLPLLVAYLNYRTGKAVLEANVDLCRRELGLGEEFYLEAVLVFRVYFPFGEDGPRGGDRKLPGRLLAACHETVLSKPDRFGRLVRYLPGYHRPTFREPLTGGHPPHRDYCFGYALDAVNLWWAVDEVTEDNGMSLFPGTAGKKFPYRTEGAPYLTEGWRLPAPRYTPLRAGEVLAMSTNELHATRLNESPHTRIVVSARVSPNEPRFFRMPSKPSFVRLGSFHPASSLDRDDFHTLWSPTAMNGAREIWGEPNEVEADNPTTRSVLVEREWPTRERTRLFDARLLEEDGRVAVRFGDKELVVFRTARGPVVVGARCPHAGYFLADGFCDGEHVHCPGHGVKFDLENGRAQCGLALERYPCRVLDGSVFLEPC